MFDVFFSVTYLKIPSNFNWNRFLWPSVLTVVLLEAERPMFKSTFGLLHNLGPATYFPASPYLTMLFLGGGGEELALCIPWTTQGKLGYKINEQDKQFSLITAYTHFITAYSFTTWIIRIQVCTWATGIFISQFSIQPVQPLAKNKVTISRSTSYTTLKKAAITLLIVGEPGDGVKRGISPESVRSHKQSKFSLPWILLTLIWR